MIAAAISDASLTPSERRIAAVRLQHERWVRTSHASASSNCRETSDCSHPDRGQPRPRRGTTVVGASERFPLPNLSGSCGFGSLALSGLRRNEEDAPRPDLCAAAGERSIELLPLIRVRRRDQQGSTLISSGRSAQSTNAFPRKCVNAD